MFVASPNVTVRDLVDALRNDGGILHVVDTETGTVFRCELEGEFDLATGKWVVGGMK